MKRNDGMLLLWPVLHAVADGAALAASMILAYHIRFSDVFARVVPVLFGYPPVRYYINAALIASLFWVLFLAFRGVYRVRLDGTSVAHETAEALGSFYLGFALLFALLFFYRGFSFSRVVAVLTLVLGSGFLVLLRLFFALLRSRLLPTRPLHRALVIGPLGEDIVQRLEQHAESGLKCVARLEDLPNQPPPPALEETVEREAVDTVILAYGFDRFSRARDLVEVLSGKRLHFLFAPDPSTIISGRLAPMTLAGLTLLRLREDPLAGWNGLVKRSFDLVVSAMLLVLLSPLFLLLALLVALTSRGPVYYKQVRVGLDGRPFTLFKFRSMKVDAEAGTGAVWAKKNDPRTTAVGGFLRRWSLDELPQLWNVLKGDMSLVGPRPERPEFVNEFQDHVPRYMERHRVRSGLTGWAQVNGLRGQAPIGDRTRYDLFYVENWSLGFDLWILARTVVAVIAGRDAY